MADRTTGVAARLTVDLPGTGEDSTVTVNLIDPAGEAGIPITAMTFLGDTRWAIELNTHVLDMSGIWQMVAAHNGGSKVLTFSVGPRPFWGITRHDLRNAIASRVDEVVFSEVEDYVEQALIDSTLIGGSSAYRGWWVLPGTGHPFAGVPRRVVAFAADGMVLNNPWPIDLLPGDAYTIMKTDPREVDRAIAIAISDLATTARIPVISSGVPIDPSTLEFSVPGGMTHVSEVATTTPLLTTAWSMLAGRRGITTGLGPTTTTVTVIGTRPLHQLVWDDSVLDIEPAAVIARAAMVLHAARAGGPATDIDEHLRRQLAAQDEYERSLRRTVGRFQSGSRLVLD